MNPSAPFIRRPVATTLLVVAIVAFGWFAYRQLAVSDLPNVDLPTLLVTAALPGASPETMAATVATPLERQFTTIAGLTSMTSTNGLGLTTIVLQFDLARSIDAAAQDVQAAISAAGAQLPPELPAPPTYRKVNPADQPILYLALTSRSLPMYAVNRYAEDLLAQQFSTVSGVAQVQVFGSKRYAVRVQLDPRALAARGLGIDEVAQAIRSGNVNLPTGVLQGASRALTIQTNGQLESAAEYAPLVVGWFDQAPVRLRDLGQVVDSVEVDTAAAYYVDQPAVVLAVQRQPGTNTVAVAEGVKAMLPRLVEAMPAAVELHTIYDRSLTIQASVEDVQFTLVLTLLLVVLVIFLFLRSARATFIPAVSLPLSILATFMVMWALGYSLDNLSLMALTLSLGFVVDDAVVVLENIVRHRELGEGQREAAFKGSEEIAFTIVSMTISLAAVFIPILFLPGIVGRLFREFSVVIATAILISGVVSLTVTPMLCARMLGEGEERRPGRLSRLFEAGFERSVHGYERWLRATLRHRLLLMAGSLLVLVASGYLFVRIPKDFLPAEDTGQLFAQTLARQGISFEAMDALQKEAARIIAEDPAVLDFMSVTGGGGTISSTNTGIMFLHLKDRHERAPAAEVLERLRPRLAQIPGLQVFMQVPPSIRIGGTLTRGEYQYTLQGSDTKALYASAQELEARMRQMPGLVDVSSDLQLENPELDIRIDRDRASSLGLTLQQVQDALFSAFGTREVSTIYGTQSQYQVIVELRKEDQRDPSVLDWLSVRASTGELVPLRAVATVEESFGPVTVQHSGQLPSVTLSFNLAPGASLGAATDAVVAAANELVPESVIRGFAGSAQVFAESSQALGLLLVIAVLVIYLVLGILYESYLHPLTILSALPFAGFGALVTLIAFNTSLTIYAFVGIIMLVGLVKKNGIMMVDFAIERRRHGLDAFESIVQASVVRFRPIMMTTLAAIMGTLPIALGFGAGAEVRRGLGLAVVGGLVFSQTITLFVTPVVYTYLEQLSEKWGGWRERRAARRHRPARA